jgi:hypothetical protein
MKTIDLELAKELQSVCKEKGIELRKSRFMWFNRFKKGGHIEYDREEEYYIHDDWLLSAPVAPAYTLDELLGWLPKEIIIKSNLIAELRIGYRKNVFGCWYEYAENDRTILYSGEIVDSLCRLLIWTIKEGYLK